MPSMPRGASPARIGALGTALIFAILTSVTCGGGGSKSPTAPSPPTEVTGSGVVAQRSIAIGDFTIVDHSAIGGLFLEQGSSNSLTIAAEDNILPYLQAGTMGGTLTLSVQENVDFSTTIPIEYRLTAATLARVELDGVGFIRCERFEDSELSLVATGVGNMRFTNLELEDLDVRLSGVGGVRTSGSATRQTVVVSAVGDYNGDNLSSNEADVEIQGMGNATVRVRNRLVARVNGSGCVYYIGSPSVEATITGSGCVEKIGD